MGPEMQYTILLTALTTAGYTLLYMLVHELLHYIAAVAVGAPARLGLSTDSIAPSLSVRITDSVEGVRRLVILYAPYTFNILAIIFAPYALKIIAILTLPNILLECETLRGKVTLALALAAEAVLAAAVGKLLL